MILFSMWGIYNTTISCPTDNYLVALNKYARTYALLEAVLPENDLAVTNLQNLLSGYLILSYEEIVKESKE